MLLISQPELEGLLEEVQNDALSAEGNFYDCHWGDDWSAEIEYEIEHGSISVAHKLQPDNEIVNRMNTICDIIREAINEVHKDHYSDCGWAYDEIKTILIKAEDYLRSIEEMR